MPFVVIFIYSKSKFTAIKFYFIEVVKIIIQYK